MIPVPRRKKQDSTFMQDAKSKSFGAETHNIFSFELLDPAAPAVSFPQLGWSMGEMLFPAYRCCWSPVLPFTSFSDVCGFVTCWWKPLYPTCCVERKGDGQIIPE